MSCIYLSSICVILNKLNSGQLSKLELTYSYIHVTGRTFLTCISVTTWTSLRFHEHILWPVTENPTFCRRTLVFSLNLNPCIIAVLSQHILFLTTWCFSQAVFKSHGYKIMIIVIKTRSIYITNCVRLDQLGFWTMGSLVCQLGWLNTIIITNLSTVYSYEINIATSFVFSLCYIDI